MPMLEKHQIIYVEPQKLSAEEKIRLFNMSDVIVGAGGHGLATAYYLAKEHKITNVAILEKGWIGGGNVGRNTTILRSNYMWDPNGLFYEYGMKLWENLSQELNYNVMYSPRGIINLAHSDAQLNVYSRRGNSMKLNGIDAVMLGKEELKKMIPFADFSSSAKRPWLPR